VISIGGQVVHNIGIPHETAKRLLMQSAGLADASAEINDTNYANFDAESLWPYSNHTLTDFTDIPPEPADKLIFITTDSAKIAELESMFDDNLYWEISENQIVMVMNKNARKLNAVKSSPKGSASTWLKSQRSAMTITTLSCSALAELVSRWITLSRKRNRRRILSAPETTATALRGGLRRIF